MYLPRSFPLIKPASFHLPTGVIVGIESDRHVLVLTHRYANNRGFDREIVSLATS
jgi:hypothetical protein